MSFGEEDEEWESTELRTVADRLLAPVAVLGRDSTLLYVNDAAALAMGTVPERLIGRRLLDLIHPEDRARVIRELRQVAAGEVAGGMAVYRIRADTSAHWRTFETIADNLLDDPHVNGILVSSRDITDQLTHEARLHDAAYSDPLTGLPNRAEIGARLEDLVGTTGQLAVAFLGLDRFKLINDSLGHTAGDAVLKVVATRLVLSLPEQTPPAAQTHRSGCPIQSTSPSNSRTRYRRFGNPSLALRRNMSGHSKWATTKYRKGAQDKARAKIFAKCIRQVEVAAREGGGDLDANATLRTAYQKARSASVPLDTIEKAIKRGTGELEGVRYEAINYEGYGPAGVAVIVETLSDNRNRTGSEVRNLFNRNGGNMAEPGAVSWQFERKGIVAVSRAHDEDKVMEIAMEGGAENLSDNGEFWIVTCAPADLESVRQALDAAGIVPESVDLSLEPTTLVPVPDEGDAKRVLRLLEAIDDHDDVQAVHANADIADEVLAAFEG
jgi:YebC/PmpR family DNA-binding regulatory protein